MANPNVFCIDQHIIAYDRDHHEEIMSLWHQNQSNLARKELLSEIWSDYYHKYPFGTVHFIIAMMAKEGINVELPDLNKIYTIMDPNVPAENLY